jgi:unsaturated rhamnogalacturonyl hydrolase
MLAATIVAAAVTLAPSLEAEIRAIAALPGEPSVVSAAGLTKADAPILTIENRSAFDVADRHRRLVMVGGSGGPGDDAASAATVVELVRWFKQSAPAALRREWIVSALPARTFDESDVASYSRWMTFQAPDVVLEVRATFTSSDLVKALRDVPAGFSPNRTVMLDRVKRPTADLAKALAQRYPETPAISYIPAVAWTSTLRLAKLTGDQSLADTVRRQTARWISGGEPLFGSRILLTSVAGTMVFAELGGDATRLAAEGARLASARNDAGIAQYGQGWTDDMFMTSAILSRTGEFDAAAAILKSYAARLQRADGVFIHATDGPFAWGRGNGFAALGLVELLNVLPDGHAARADLLAIYRRLMAGLLPHQAPDGMWRQVIDEPGAYREETATAMLLTAMQRGVRRGWLPQSYAGAAARAWSALKAHVAIDATLVDVCTGTGAGPTRRYYLERAAITGADDRGGAMALLAAMEMW